jgi:hypothetical protein
VVGIVVGVLVLAGFARWELRAAHPLLDPRLFGHRAFTAGALSLSVQFFAFFGFIFLVLQYLQLVLGDSPLVAALSMIPVGVGMMPAARLAAPRLAARAGAARTCVLGLVLAAGGLGLLSTLDAGSSYWPLLGGLLLLGAGMGLAMTPATTAVTDALPRDKQGVGSAMNDLARELGGALGIAVLGSVLTSTYRAHLSLPEVPRPLAEHARSSLALASRVSPDVAGRARDAFADGMSYALLGGAAAVLAAAIAVAVLLRRS